MILDSALADATESIVLLVNGLGATVDALFG